MNKPQLSEIEFGDLMTLEAFTETCKRRGFIDYDGFGELSDGTKVWKFGPYVYPSEIVMGIREIPDWATHIVWYNR